MSDQADSERTRSCTRLLYIPTRKTPNRTMTARTIQAMQILLRCGFKGTLAHEGESFKVARIRSDFETLNLLNLAFFPWGVVSGAGADLEVFFHGSDLDGAVASIGIEVGGLVGNVVLAAQLVFNGGKGIG